MPGYVKCSNCEQNVSADEIVCPYCGISLKDATPIVNPIVNTKPIPIAPMWKCRKCGHENPESALYCEMCPTPKNPTSHLRPTPHDYSSTIPEGMYVPGPDDLKPKRTKQ